MDYLTEARTFIQQARAAENSDIIKSDLEMAHWLLTRAIAEREDLVTNPRSSQGDEPGGKEKPA